MYYIKTVVRQRPREFVRKFTDRFSCAYNTRTRIVRSRISALGKTMDGPAATGRHRVHCQGGDREQRVRRRAPSVPGDRRDNKYVPTTRPVRFLDDFSARNFFLRSRRSDGILFHVHARPPNNISYISRVQRSGIYVYIRGRVRAKRVLRNSFPMFSTRRIYILFVDAIFHNSPPRSRFSDSCYGYDNNTTIHAAHVRIIMAFIYIYTYGPIY